MENPPDHTAGLWAHTRWIHVARHGSSKGPVGWAFDDGSETPKRVRNDCRSIVDPHILRCPPLKAPNDLTFY